MGLSTVVSKPNQRTWWKDAVIYQIWPASFKDSNADGLGDIQGIIDSLDHICSLGVDAIWLSPIFESPQVDLGYDISDYESIYEPYGTISDVETLIRECHNRGVRVLFDLVINHTSDQHGWFKESRSSNSNDKSDWYIWRPAKYENGQRRPPNNWQSFFGGSAWAWDDTRQEYYLHLFAENQPDVNWNCRELRTAIYQSAIVFWLDKGIDGFRIDAMGVWSKDQSFPDAPDTDPCAPFNHQPQTLEILHEINTILSRYGDIMTVGEFGSLDDTSIALKYVSARESRVGMGFQFESACIGYSLSSFDVKPFTLVDFKKPFAKWQQFIAGTDGWTTMFLENHDVARSVSRFASDHPNFRVAAAKMLAMMHVTATGTLFLYQGQEIGMTNIPAHWPIEEYKDISTQRYWDSMTKTTATTGGSETDQLSGRRKLAMANILKVARDHSRTPVQWNNSANAGFTTSPKGPWMRVNDNYVDINVSQQNQDTGSVLSYWRKLIALRKEYVDLFAHGAFRYVDEDNSEIMSYMKTFGNQSALVVLNFTAMQRVYEVPENFRTMHLLETNCSDMRGGILQPFECRLYMTTS